MPTETAKGYTHEALFFGSQDDLVAAARPFITEGLEAGDEVVLVCTNVNNDALSDAVGPQEVVRMAREDLFQRAPSAIATYREFLQGRLDAGATGVRLLGEIDFGTEPRTWREWARFESLCNQALTSYPLWSMCAYDTRVLSDEVIGHGRHTHPHLRHGGARTDNPDYVQPSHFLTQLVDSAGGPLEEAEPVLELRGVDDLALVRRHVTLELQAARTDRAVVDDFVLAVNEVSTNAMRHGLPPVDLRLWAAGERAVCTVSDHGTGVVDPLSVYYSPGGESLPQGRMGLWLVRQLCDEFTFHSAPGGFTVRLGTRLRP